MKLQGIYKIENKINGKVYIGQSSNMEIRWNYHKMDLIDGKHHQRNLQQDYEEMVAIERENSKNNKYFGYINIKRYVLDNYYIFEPILLLDDYDKNTIEDIEDKYILQYREMQEGYKQKTNKEIREYKAMKDELHERQVEIWSKLKECEKSFAGVYFKSVDKDFYLRYGEKRLEVYTDILLSYEKYHLDKIGMYLFAYFINAKSKRFKRNTYTFKTSLSELIEFSVKLIKYNSCYNIYESLRKKLNSKDLKKILSIFKDNNGIDIDVKINKLKVNDTFNITINKDNFNKGLYLYYEDIINKGKIFKDLVSSYGYKYIESDEDIFDFDKIYKKRGL